MPAGGSPGKSSAPLTPVAFGRTNPDLTCSRRAVTNSPMSLGEADEVCRFEGGKVLKGAGGEVGDGGGGEEWIKGLTGRSGGMESLGERLRKRGEEERARREKLWESRGGTEDASEFE